MGVMLNIRTDRTLSDLLARFDVGDTDLLNGVLAKQSSGLKVLLGPSAQGVRLPLDVLNDVLSCLQTMFDFVIVDLHSAVRNAVAPLFKIAHAALLVITPEMVALHQGRSFARMLESTLPDVQLNIVLNRSNLPSGVPVDAIRRHLKMQIAVEIPDDQSLVTASINRGVPLVSSHPRSVVARAIEKLGRDLAPTESDASEPRAQAVGPLARLIPRNRPI
jgi:pilus assembly protein CpaE